MKSDAKDELLKSSSEESGSEDDEEAWKLTDEVEKEFFKTLSQIKSRDPKIYQKDVEFFKDVPIPEHKPKEKTKSAPRFTLREYERQFVIEKGGELSDEEPPAKSLVQVSYVEEQRALKDSLKALIQSDSEYESEAEWGGLFKKRQTTKTEEEKEEENYKEWLKGQNSEAPEDDVAKEMKPLRDFWTNPNLKQEDQFLRDYLLNKRFLEADEKGDSGVDVGKPLDESEKEDTEDELDKLYSHRFEEPDHEFIKRYPRVMGNSVRRKDDSRRRKREEIKERKLKEKEKKKGEIKQKQKLKKKEIEQKLEEIRQLTGNEKLAFENVLDKDFDIDEHDKAMQRLFSEEFYSQDDPNFNPNDAVDGEGDWHEDGQEDKQGDDEFADNNDELQCEDPNFNMDCDYDPAVENTKLKTSRSRRRKDKHRRTTVNEAVKRDKPVFDPATHKSYQEYLDQYYAIDCEDFIGDLPCRFKYRRTIPNSYGLTIEEILAADPKELERWCSIKRITQLKPSFKEKGDAMCYKRRAANEELKRKILPSLYKTPDGEKSTIGNLEDGTSQHNSKNKTNNIENNMTTVKKREIPPKNNLVNNYVSKKRKTDGSEMIVQSSKRRKLVPDQGKPHKSRKLNENIKSKKKIVNRKISNEKSSLLHMSDARLEAYGIKPKKFRNKLKYNGVDSHKNKSKNNSDSNKQNVQRKKKPVTLSDSTVLARKKGNIEKNQHSTKISKEKKIITNKLTNENKSNGWVISNAT